LPPEVVGLEIPAGDEWTPVVRLVLGGVGDRLDFGFEAVDDLQLAVESLIAEAAPEGSVRLSVELGDGAVNVRVSGLREEAITRALRAPSANAEGVDLHRVLRTVVDSYTVEEPQAGRVTVRLEKSNGGERA